MSIEINIKTDCFVCKEKKKLEDMKTNFDELIFICKECYPKNEIYWEHMKEIWSELENFGDKNNEQKNYI